MRTESAVDILVEYRIIESMLQRRLLDPEPVKFTADFQTNWAGVIPHLGRDKYYTESTENLSIQGDAPKCFLHMKEYGDVRKLGERRRWVSYIAKVGSKWYPGESITEHMLTRVGVCFGVNVAHSHLRFVGRQVRFLSRYFLRRGSESLVHGIEIFKRVLDEEMVNEIAAARAEQDFYTFQTVCSAMKDSFSECWCDLMAGLVEMLAFDALVGHNDRHPANWGIIVPIKAGGRPRFSPIYDTARALFWNDDEKKVANRLTNEQAFEGYINRSRPQIGWDGRSNIGHFELVRLVNEEFPEYGAVFAKFRAREPLDRVRDVLETEFSRMMSKQRIELIGRCLRRRHQLLGEALS